MILWNGKHEPQPERELLPEMMLPPPPATEALFATLERSLMDLERREKVLETEIADRTAELENVRIAKTAAQAGIFQLPMPPVPVDPDSDLTARMGEALEGALTLDPDG